MESQMTTLSAGILLFLIMDPLGNIPLFLSLLKDVPPKRRRRVMVRELLIALGVLLAFLFGGQYILKLLQLKQESISIAGGIVLFLIGIRMVFPPADGGGIFGKSGGGEPFIVPMAIPGVAGPSAMAALLLLTNTQPGRTRRAVPLERPACARTPRPFRSTRDERDRPATARHRCRCPS